MSETRIDATEIRTYKTLSSTCGKGKQTLNGINGYLTELNAIKENHFPVGDTSTRPSIEALYSAVNDISAIIECVNSDIDSLFKKIDNILTMEDNMASKM